MAKITAYGHEEVARFRDPDNGGLLIITRHPGTGRARILRNAGRGWTLVGYIGSVDNARAYIARRFMTHVEVAR